MILSLVQAKSHALLVIQVESGHEGHCNPDGPSLVKVHVLYMNVGVRLTYNWLQTK